MRDADLAFMRTLAHDLKAPLASLSWHVQVLMTSSRAGRLEAAVLNEMLQAIAAATAEAVGTIDELHDLTLLESGSRPTLHLETVDLCAVVGHIAATGPFGVQHTIRIEQEEPHVWVLADPARINRVMTRLLDNACTDSARGSTIVISIGQEMTNTLPSAIVRVRDSGVGEGPRLVKARALVVLHGGSLDVDSVDGVARTVSVRLPLAAAPMTPDDAVEVCMSQ